MMVGNGAENGGRLAAISVKNGAAWGVGGFPTISPIYRGNNAQPSERQGGASSDANRG